MINRFVLTAVLAMPFASWLPSAWAAGSNEAKEADAEARALSEKEPGIALILRKYGASRLDEIDWSQGYEVDLQAGTVEPAADSDIIQLVRLNIYANGSFIDGFAETETRCTSGGMDSRVYGHMASVVARDPILLDKEGDLYASGLNFMTTRVDFSILKIMSARNPLNRTSMETTHVSECNARQVIKRFVTTWPPQRVQLAIDTTGSMGAEIGGLKAGLAAFINTSEERPNGQAVAYELIGFKDSSSVLQESTFDRDVALAAVNSLYASGGGDCPEDSVGALQLALKMSA